MATTAEGTVERRMQGALSPVLAVGPEFLAGRLHADDMAQTMVRAVQDYARQEQERQTAGAVEPEVASDGRVAEQLEAALIEVYTCGSGYLAARCDSDCVVRTMTQIMNEFGGTAAVH